MIAHAASPTGDWRARRSGVDYLGTVDREQPRVIASWLDVGGAGGYCQI